MLESSAPILIVVGPTASGKTDLSLELARRLDGEIVSADSVQIYRYFDIGSGKPTAEERGGVPYHLIDCVEPGEPMDAARFAELATQRLNEILARGRRPIVAGGTFLWVRALIYGLSPGPPGDPELRAEHKARAEREGRAALHRELSRIDPVSAARLQENDLLRVSRALEVFELTGVPLSEWHAGHGFRTPRFQARLIGVRRERDELDGRIRTRIEAMLDQGWLDEVRDLLARGFGESRAMASVGYSQVAAALQSGEPIDRAALVESVFRATRVFARRQRTWLRDQDVRWVEHLEDALA
ncbi:MAG: tRNA (adenosine(37)-N6)-dimethylallyltransferase MiaA [Myxococcota bacterium]|nr:tRNA (adenosine(37)-N6)-dimethylallyltransferase MiaA [Myxococcota bacterium]